MATAQQTFETTTNQIEQAVAQELINECETLGQLKGLDGEVLDRTENGGRVREQCLRVISDAEDVCWIEDGDRIIHSDGRQTEILDIGSDVSDMPGLHICEKRDYDESAVHLKLIQRWLRKGHIAIVGVRTRKFNNPDSRPDA